MPKTSWLALGAAVSVSCGCGGRPVLSPPPVPSPPAARCQVKASVDRPLIVEWDASSRNDVEALIKRQGAIVVRYDGCEMELLRGCRAPGTYRYMAATQQTESVVIHTADELYARLPIGAVTLEGELERAGGLRLDMSIVSKYAAADAALGLDRFQGSDCAGATHVVVGLTAGSFEMVSGRSSGGSAGVAVAGAGRSHEERMMRRAGTRAACEASKLADQAPPAGCGALLRLELVPIECPAGSQLEAGRGCTTGGDDTLPVRAGGPDGDNHESDNAFAKLVMDVAHALPRAAKGERVESNVALDFGSDPEVQKELSKLGSDAHVLMAGGLIGMIDDSTTSRERLVVRAQWMVHPNGQWRWGKVRAEVDTPDLDEAAVPDTVPADLRAVYRHLTSSLASCDLGPLSLPSDFAHLHPDIDNVGNILKEDEDYRLGSAAELRTTCAAVAETRAKWLVGYPVFDVAYGNLREYLTFRLRMKAAPAGGYAADVRLRHGVYSR